MRPSKQGGGEGWVGYIQYAPSLNFKTCCFAYLGESHVAVNIYPNRASIIGTLRSNEAMTQEHLKNNGLVIILNEVYPVFNKTTSSVSKKTVEL